VLATASDDLGSLYVRHPDGSVVLLKDDPTRSVGLIAADTNFMAWQEGSGGTVWTGYTRVEVWAAPFTTDPSSFHPYKAADIPNNGLYDFAFGEGWYIVRLEAGGVRFVHIADAKYVDIAPPPGLAFIRAVNVAAGEAWFLMRTSPGIKNPVTVARYDLSAVLANLP
jgi:hypothetical protein